MKKICLVCSRPAEVNVWGSFKPGAYCWKHYLDQKIADAQQNIETDGFMIHDLSVANENTEDHD